MNKKEPIMMECLGFTLDKVHSSSIGTNGLYIVNVNGTENNIPIFGGQSVIAQELITADFPLFVKTKKQVIEFSLSFSLLDESFTPQIESQVLNFFLKNKPVEFILDENRNAMLYVVPMINEVEIVKFHNSIGYFEVFFHATIPCWLTTAGSYDVDLDLRGENTDFSIYNPSNIPESSMGYENMFESAIQITVNSAETDLIITNNTNNKQITVHNCLPGEIIEIKGRHIKSSLGRNVFKDWNRQGFVLDKGENSISVNAPCKVYSSPQYPILL